MKGWPTLIILLICTIRYCMLRIIKCLYPSIRVSGWRKLLKVWILLISKYDILKLKATRRLSELCMNNQVNSKLFRSSREAHWISATKYFIQVLKSNKNNLMHKNWNNYISMKDNWRNSIYNSIIKRKKKYKAKSKKSKRNMKKIWGRYWKVNWNKYVKYISKK